MALTVSLEITSITADRLTGLLTDNTTFGGAEIARAACAVFVTGQKMNADSTVDETLTLTGDTDDPQTDASWTFNIPKDGWFRFCYAAVPDWAVTSYSIYDAVQDPTTSIVYRSLANSNSVANASDLLVTANWEVVSSPGLLSLNEGEANESSNIDSDTYSVVLTPNGEYGFASAISEASDDLCNLDCTVDDLNAYVKVAALIDGCYVRSDRSQFSQAERIARRLEAILE